MEWRARDLNYLWCLEDDTMVYAFVYMPAAGGFEVEVWDYGRHCMDFVGSTDTMHEAQGLAKIMVQLRRSEYDAIQ
jgi:hypothetical protein